MGNSLVRAIARKAGCHIYMEDEDVLFANQRFVMVHASTTGKKRLVFPRKCTPFEVYEKKTYGTSALDVQFNMEAGETRMFHLDDVL